MLLLLKVIIACVVSLCDFGPYESTVQAQSIWYKGTDINETYDENSSLTIDPAKSSSSKKGMVRGGSFNMLMRAVRATENITHTSNPNGFSAEEISIHTKFNNKIKKLKAETELQKENYEILLGQIKKDTNELEASLRNVGNRQNTLNQTRRCGPAKLGELESRLDSHMENTQFAFFAQRDRGYSKPGPIPFTSTSLNKGNRFFMKSGEFIPNVTAIYHFYFSGLKTKSEEAGTSKLIVQIKHVNNGTTSVLAEGHVNSQDRYGWFQVQVQATVHLTALTSKVYVALVEGSLHESGSDAHRLTVFGGFLVE